MFTEKLAEKIVLVSLSIGKWSGRKSDGRAALAVEREFNAKEDAGQFVKNLLPKDVLRRIRSIENAARSYFYANTLPWSEGTRVLPAQNLVEFMTQIGEYSREYNRAAKRLQDEYDNILEQAKRRLGDLFNEADFPIKEELPKLFYLRTTFLPFPEVATDFRLRAAEEVVEQVKQTIVSQVQDFAKTGSENSLQVLIDTMEEMTKKSNIHYRAIEKVKKVAKVTRTFFDVFEDKRFVPDIDLLLGYEVDNTPEQKKQFQEFCRQLLADIRNKLNN